jgi:hypothetical protein
MKRKGKDLAWIPQYGKCGPRQKLCWPCRHVAQRVARHLGHTAYRCPDCDKWHLTHHPPKVHAAISYLIESIRDDQRKSK